MANERFQVIQNALSPERSVGDSMQLSVIPSVTNVYVSNDLQVRTDMYSNEPIDKANFKALGCPGTSLGT